VLSETYDSVNLRIQNLRFRSNFNRDKWDAAVVEHTAMIDALERGDGGALRELLEEHLRHKRDAVLEELNPASNAAARRGNGDAARAHATQRD